MTINRMTTTNDLIYRQNAKNSLPHIDEVFPEHTFRPTGAPYRGDPPSPELSEGSGSSNMTPTSSRKSSLTQVASSGARRPKTSKRTLHELVSTNDRRAKRACSESGQSASDDDSLTNVGAKAGKEREARYCMATMLQGAEDTCRCVVPGIDRLSSDQAKPQSASNGNSSGLRYDKRNVLQLVITRFIKGLIEERQIAEEEDDRARGEGRPETAVALFEEKFIQEFIASAQAEDVFADTILASNDSSERCNHHKDEKSCFVHAGAPGADDWRECRINRRRAIAMHNRNERRMRGL